MNDKEFTLKGTIKTATSQKGNEYKYLDLKLTDIYSKRVFLDEAEKVLLMSNSTKSSNPFGK